MVLAIEVLRGHLQELNQVYALCDNFTSKYVQNLKGKMPMDIVLEDRDVVDGIESQQVQSKTSQSQPIHKTQIDNNLITVSRTRVVRCKNSSRSSPSQRGQDLSNFE